MSLRRQTARSSQRVAQQRDVGIAELSRSRQPHRAGWPDREGRDAVEQDAGADHDMQLVDQTCGEQAVPGRDAAEGHERAALVPLAWAMAARASSLGTILVLSRHGPVSSAVRL